MQLNMILSKGYIGARNHSSKAVLNNLDALASIRQAEESLCGVFNLMEETAYYNQEKILKAFQRHQIRDTHFASSSGYGYGDMGRDELESICLS